MIHQAVNRRSCHHRPRKAAISLWSRSLFLYPYMLLATEPKGRLSLRESEEMVSPLSARSRLIRQASDVQLRY